MRRSAAALALARRLCGSGVAPTLAAAAGRLVQCGVSGAPAVRVGSAEAALQRPSWRCFSAEGGGSGSDSDILPGNREAWEAVRQLSADASQIAEEGDLAGARQRLKEGERSGADICRAAGCSVPVV